MKIPFKQTMHFAALSLQKAVYVLDRLYRDGYSGV